VKHHLPAAIVFDPYGAAPRFLSGLANAAVVDESRFGGEFSYGEVANEHGNMLFPGKHFDQHSLLVDAARASELDEIIP